jgi:hypothetical protein
VRFFTENSSFIKQINKIDSFGKSGWLQDREHPTLAHMTSLVSAITNLTMKTAEEWQIANYGLGGQYEPHFDFARVRIIIFNYFPIFMFGILFCILVLNRWQSLAVPLTRQLVIESLPGFIT